MIKKMIFFALVAVFSLEPVYACSPVSFERLQKAKPRMEVSDDGRTLLKMFPARYAKENGRIVLKREAYTLAFSMTDNGQLEQIWSMKGVYGVGGLYRDGQTLLALGSSKAFDAPVVQIFLNGKKMKSYSAVNFGYTKDNAPPSGGICAIPLFKSRTPYKKELNSWQFITTHGQEYILNVLTGVLRRVK